jgi:hypothetical protein
MAAADLFRFIERGLRASARALRALAGGKVIDRDDLICGALALDHLAIVSDSATEAVDLANELRSLAMRGAVCLLQEERRQAGMLGALIDVIVRQVETHPSVQHCMHVLPCPDHSPGDE